MGLEDLDLDVLDGIENAQETFSRNYLKTNGVTPGSSASYELEIKNVKMDKNRKKITYFAVDMIVRGTNCDQHRIGDQVNYYTGSDKDGFLGNVKNFAAAALGSVSGDVVDGASITKEVIAEMIKDGGELVRGQRVNCVVTLVPTQQGGTYSRHVFAPKVQVSK